MAAKNVTNPNKVPGDLEQAQPFQGDMSAETLALLKDVKSDEPETLNVEVPTDNTPQIGTGQPTRQIARYNSKGKQTGWDTVLDKSAQFLQPGAAMRKAAHHATIKGQSGKVLVFGETGVLLARFLDRPTAERYLNACGISLEKLLNKTRKDPTRKEIRPAVPVKETQIIAA